MSQELISLNPDLQQLVHEGFEVEIRTGHLILHRVPYVTGERRVKFGELVTPITFNGQLVGQPQDHTMYFRGEYPCDDKGQPIEAIRNNSNRQELATGLWVDHYFSAKPHNGNYENFYDKMTNYARMLSRYAKRIDPSVTAQSGQLTLTEDPKDPFLYMETASSRAGITIMSEALSNDRIGIVGLGGTGSYILDYVSKTRVAEIHLFDGDKFQQHNAFRSPGAANKQDISAKRNKSEFYAAIYGQMRNGVIPHAEYLKPDKLEEVTKLDFVFVSIDDNETKRWLLPALDAQGMAFIDVGMGIEKTDNKLLGVMRTSISIPGEGLYSPQAQKVQAEVELQEMGEYERNVQIVELNALNAALAVIRWKKFRGFYLDLERERQSTYTLVLFQFNSDRLATENQSSAGS